MRSGPIALLLLLVACAHAPEGALPAAPPAGVGDAQAMGIAATVRRAQARATRGDLDSARALLTSALERAEAEGDVTGKARLQAELALVLADQAFDNRVGTERGLLLAAEARTGAQAAGAPEIEARAVHAEALLQYGQRLWEESKDFQLPRSGFERARDLHRTLGDRAGVAQETFFLGLTHEQEGNTALAGQLYQEARALAEEAGDRSTLAYAFRHLGGLAEERGELDEALALQRKCLALREEIGLVRLMPFALIAIGDLERRKGALADARASYTRALAIVEEMHGTSARLWSTFGLGAVDEAEGRLSSALERYDAAHGMAERLGSKSWAKETGTAAERVRAKLASGTSPAIDRVGTARSPES